MTVLLVVQVVFAVVGLVITGRQDIPVLSAFIVAGTFLTSALIVGLMHGRFAWRKLAIRRPAWAHLALVLLLSVPTLFAVVEATAWLADALRWVGTPESFVEMKIIEEETAALRQYPPWLAVSVVLVFGALLPAVGEELFFRGFLGRGLVARWGPARGVLLTSLLFGAMHFHPLHSAIAALIGVVLHAVYLWTRSLVTPVVLHAVYNGQAFLVSALAHGTTPDLVADVHLPPLLTVTAVAAMVGLLYLLHRSRVRWVRPDGSDWSRWFPSAEMPPADVDARPVAGRLKAGRMAVVVVVYLLFIAVLGWELSRS